MWGRLLWLSGLLGLACVACGDDDDDGNGGGGAQSAANCESRCARKIGDCNLPVGDVAAACEQLCGEGLTEDQLSCYERATCSALGDGSHGCDEPSGGDDNCPQLTCECNGQQQTASYQVGGRCLETCDEVCDLLGQLGGLPGRG